MKLKSYFSGTVEAAMELARKELGEDALLVNARPAAPEARYLGAYEVVFGLLPATAEAPPALASTTSEPLREEVADLRRQLERLTRSLTLSSSAAPPASPSVGMAAYLAGEELDSCLIQRITDGERLEDCFSVDPSLGGVVALAGPPGAGKTSTLMKLAARYGLQRRRPPLILTADVHRIGAPDQIRSCAAILGIPCEVAHTPLALAQLLEEHSSRGLVLIDTPGFSSREMDDASQLASVFASHPGIDVHLVLPASMKPVDMARVSDAYALLHPSKLIFTRMDETSHFGALVGEASRLGLPISFLGTGQQIPDHLEEASTRRLCELILGGCPVPAPAPLRKGAAA